VSGLTQIPGVQLLPVTDSVAAAPTWSAVPPQTPAETQRPVEPVASSEFQPTDLTGDALANAIAFTAIAAMVHEAARSSRVGDIVQTPADLPEERRVGSQIMQFQAALAASGAQSWSDDQLVDAVASLQPQPNPRPNLPLNVERFAAMVRGQILQDYRIAFMVHGRLTPAVAQLLF